MAEIEPQRNDKGLTRQQYERKNRRIRNGVFGALGLGMVIAIGGTIYSGTRSAPPRPESYQTYADAQQTLTMLDSLKERLALSLRDFPYTNETFDTLVREAVNFNPEKWDQAVNTIRQDISQMGLDHPEFLTYENNLQAHYDNNVKLGGGSVFVGAGVMLIPFLAGLIANRPKYIGKDIWQEERDAEEGVGHI